MTNQPPGNGPEGPPVGATEQGPRRNFNRITTEQRAARVAAAQARARARRQGPEGAEEALGGIAGGGGRTQQNERADQMAQEMAQQAQQDLLRAERYARMPANQRERVITLQNATLDRLYQNRGLTLDPDQMAAIDLLIARAQDEINAIQSAPAAPDTPGQPTARVSQDEVDKAYVHLQQELSDLTELSKKSVEDLSGEQISEQAKLEALKRKLQGPLNAAEKSVAEAQVRDSEARVKAIEDLKANKTPVEEAAANKQADSSRQEELKAQLEKQEQLKRESSSVAELQASIGAITGNVTGIEANIANIDAQIAAATDPAVKIDLEKQKLDLLNQAVELRGKINLDQEALKVAQEKARVESGIGDVMSRENIRKMSPADYLKLSTEERAKYLEEVAEVVNADRGRLLNIRQRMERGEPVSIEDRALFAKDVSDALIQHGRDGYSMRNLRRIQSRYPEVYNMITEKVLGDKATVKQIREQFPNNWERMIDFAKNNPGWLMLLLGIIAAPALAVGIAVSGGAAGTLAGGAVAVGGGAASGFGVSRRDWN